MSIVPPPRPGRSTEADPRPFERRGWRRRGEALVRDFRFRDFEEARRFADRVAECAVDYGRRPDMEIHDPNLVRLSIVNPHHAGFTLAEQRLAEKVEACMEA